MCANHWPTTTHVIVVSEVKQRALCPLKNKHTTVTGRVGTEEQRSACYRLFGMQHDSNGK